MPWINGQSSGTRIANGGGLVVVNADGSITITPASGTGVLLGVAPPATATRALMQIGSGPVDGVTVGHYTGSASGGGYGANFASGYAGDHIRTQVAGVDYFRVDGSGNLTALGSVNAGTAGVFAKSAWFTGGDNVNFDVHPPSINGNLRVVDGGGFSVGSNTPVATIRRDGLGIFGTAALATKVKAGVPADADWTLAAPPDGTIVGDSTDSKIYIRLGGTWKAVVVA